MNKTLLYALFLAILLIVGETYTINHLQQEKAIYKANQEALLSDVEFYKTESGLNAASVQKLTLSYNELKENYSNVCETAKELKLKVKRMQSVSTSATATDVKFITVVKDSIVYRDGKLDSLLTFRWRDPWVDVCGNISKDSIDVSVHSTDTLIQIVHRVPHKFWFIKWGTKAIKQEVVSSNPHTQITYSKIIELR